MPDDEFDSLFDDDPPKSGTPAGGKDHRHLDEDHLSRDPSSSEHAMPSQREQKGVPHHVEQQKKRSADDFQPDMDALLISAQSPLIIEGMKYLTAKDFSAATLQIYAEALKGVEVFIKILERNPNSYRNLRSAIQADTDCREIESVAFHLYRHKHREDPETDSEILRSYEMLRNSLKIGYNKALISSSIAQIKKYYLLSGGIDEDKITAMVRDDSKEIKSDVARFTQHLNIAVQLMKLGDAEITKGLRGRDTNTFIIRASQLLACYYKATNNPTAEESYRRMHENYKKYFIIRE